jgi:hypothetical protein
MGSNQVSKLCSRKPPTRAICGSWQAHRHNRIRFARLSTDLIFLDTLIHLQITPQKDEDLNLLTVNAVSETINPPVALVRSPETPKNDDDTLTPKVKLFC